MKVCFHKLPSEGLGYMKQSASQMTGISPWVCLSWRGKNRLIWRWAWAINFTSRFKWSSWAFSIEDISSSQYARENWLVSDFFNGSQYLNLKIKYEHVKKAHKKSPQNPNDNKQSNKKTPSNTKRFEEKKNVYQVLSVLFVHSKTVAEKLMLWDVFKLGFQQDLGQSLKIIHSENSLDKVEKIWLPEHCHLE